MNIFNIIVIFINFRQGIASFLYFMYQLQRSKRFFLLSNIWRQHQTILDIVTANKPVKLSHSLRTKSDETDKV